MAKPFFERLKKYFFNVGKVLKGEADAASIFPNTTDIGISKEWLYANVLKLHLPSSCNVALGGFIFDQKGNESKQIDILITNDTSLQYNFYNKNGTGKTFACIDGCIGVVSVKSMLDTAGLIDSLDNIVSIPDNQSLDYRHLPHVRIMNYDEIPCKIIFAFNGIKEESLMKSLNEYYFTHSEIPYFKRPNVIHVVGKYVIIRTDKNENDLSPNTFYAMSDETDVAGLYQTIFRLQRIAAGSRYIFYDYEELQQNLPL